MVKTLHSNRVLFQDLKSQYLIESVCSQQVSFSSFVITTLQYCALNSYCCTSALLTVGIDITHTIYRLLQNRLEDNVAKYANWDTTERSVSTAFNAQVNISIFFSGLK